MKKYYSLVAENKEANVTIYGDITSWPWIESDVSSYNLSKEIDGLDVDTINVYINSYGGEVTEGWAIYNALKRHKAKIRTVCDGLAASISAVIFAAGDERIMSNLSLLFVHNAWTYAAGNADELRKTADDLQTMSDMSKKAFMDIINITEEELDDLLTGESYITPQDALAKGFATSIVNDNTSKVPGQSAKKKIMERLLNQVETPKEPINPPEPPKEPDPDPKQNKPRNLLAALFR